MKVETALLLIGVGLYLVSRKSIATSPLPGQPGFVGPVQGSSAAIPPIINGPVIIPSPSANAGLQTCAGNDGGTFFWPMSQSCPYTDFVSNGVPYYIDAIGKPIPQTY
jgi:hypothetical protein